MKGAKLAALAAVILSLSPAAGADDFVSVRSLGMGQSISTVLSDASSVFVNPAGIGLNPKSAIYLNYNLCKDNSFGMTGAVALALPGFLNIGFGYYSEAGPLLQLTSPIRSIRAAEASYVGFSAAASFLETFSLGVGIRYIATEVLDVPITSGASLSLGLLFNSIDDNIAIGILANNLAPGGKVGAVYLLPTYYDFGASIYLFDSEALSLKAAGNITTGTNVVYSTGAELFLGPLIGRGGFRFSGSAREDIFGFGLGLPGMQINYAATNIGLPSAWSRLSLSYIFGSDEVKELSKAYYNKGMPRKSRYVLGLSDKSDRTAKWNMAKLDKSFLLETAKQKVDERDYGGALKAVSQAESTAGSDADTEKMKSYITAEMEERENRTLEEKAKQESIAKLKTSLNELVAAFGNEDYKKAIKMAETLLSELDPENGEAKDILLQSDKAVKGLEDYTKAMKLANSGETILAIENFGSAMLLLPETSKKLEEVAYNYSKALRKDGQEYKAREVLQKVADSPRKSLYFDKCAEELADLNSLITNKEEMKKALRGMQR